MPAGIADWAKLTGLKKYAVAGLLGLGLAGSPALADDTVHTMAINGQVYTMEQIEADENLWDVMTDEQLAYFENWMDSEIAQQENTLTQQENTLTQLVKANEKGRAENDNLRMKKANLEAEGAVLEADIAVLEADIAQYQKKIKELKTTQSEKD